MGITKLSGSKPRLNVNIEIEYDKSTIAATAMTLAISRIVNRFRIRDKENTLFIARDRMAKITNTAREADQALKMFFEWLRIEAKDGVSKPKASFVVAVEPTTEPTSPIVSIKAG